MSTCLHPVLVPNKSRFFDASTKHPLVVYARCGKCANCQQSKAAEWYFRALKQFENAVNHNQYVQFVTLTYREQHVPRLSYFDEFSCLTKNEDMYCFMSEDLSQFHSNLRSRLKRLGYGSNCYSYFIASEYGSDDRYTHRPHYHALFYVKNDIPPLVFSRAVQASWFYGLTDGIGDDINNKSADYVLANTFHSMAVGSRKVVNYVSKYVQKSSVYSKRIEKRVKLVLNRLSNGDPLFYKTEQGRILKRRLLNVSRQFHRQSLQFGASAIDDIDVHTLYERGYFVERKENGQFNKYPISSYYHRKLCYDKVWHDGSYMWSLKDDAVPLIRLRKKNIFKSVRDRFKVVLPQIGRSDVDPEVLADYALNYKGRNYAPFDVPLLLGDLLDTSNRFVYNTKTSTVVCSRYLGNEKGFLVGSPSFGDDVIPLSKYIECNSIDDRFAPWSAGLDSLLQSIGLFERAVDSSQEVYDDKQILRNKYKQLKLSI